MNLQALEFIVFYSVVNTLGITLVKYGVSNTEIGGFKSVLTTLFTAPVFAGYVLVGLSALIGIKALSFTKFSVFGPASIGLNLLLIVMVGILFFKEPFSWSTVAGSALVLSGIYVLTQ